jgi:hypothetical protein
MASKPGRISPTLKSPGNGASGSSERANKMDRKLGVERFWAKILSRGAFPAAVPISWKILDPLFGPSPIRPVPSGFS